MSALPDRSAPPNLSDYDRARAEYRVSVPRRFNPVTQIVEAWAAESPEDLALLSLGPAGETVAEHTIGQLAARARAAARALLAQGVGPGDRVFIMLPRVPAWYEAMLGAIRIGAVVSPGTNQLTARDIAYRINRAQASVAIVSADGAGKIDAIEEPVPSLRLRIAAGAGPVSGQRATNWKQWERLLDEAPETELPEDPTAADDPMILFFTSGTVSHAKMVRHNQSYGLGHVSTARFWHDLRAGDRHWTVTDTGWAKAAWGGLFGQLHERATIVQVALGKPDADTILRLLAEHRITSFCAPPTLYRLLVQADLSAYGLETLRHCTSAGEPLNPEVIRAWQAGTGLTIYDGYGQTETTLLVANYRSLPVRPGSMGKPIPGWEVEVVDEHGAPAGDDVVGSIAVRVGEPRPVGLFEAYVDDPDANARAFRDGWYYTGDKAWRDRDGYLWFEGRDDDVITSSAYRIGPFEVESALIEHPAVMEAAVVGKEEPERTQVVTAFVILAAGYEPGQELVAELQAHTRRLTAPYKYPREIHFVAELPKTVSGKIRRGELRERLRTQAAGG
ncbi:MAG TPA: AMP-binding protein [Solirubrobacteraceae bacterium]|nr:AMP-binding protein [Solirubrobacteraceae bacterium]